MGKVYDSIDNFIMDGINTGVQAWNWTTGRTKSDLAGICSTGSSLSFSAGLISQNIFSGIVMIPIYLLIGYQQFKSYKNLESKEITALEKGMKDINVEQVYELKKNCSPAIGAVFTSIFLPPTISGERGCSELLAGTGLITLGEYVIRAKNFPRRKNALSRGLDKLSEAIASYQRQPVPVQTYSLNEGGEETQ